MISEKWIGEDMEGSKHGCTFAWRECGKLQGISVTVTGLQAEFEHGM
jgi:hypothetical protein